MQNVNWHKKHFFRITMRKRFYFCHKTRYVWELRHKSGAYYALFSRVSRRHLSAQRIEAFETSSYF